LEFLLKEEFDSIITGLLQIKTEIELGQFHYTTELEDIHMHIEYRLTHLIGQAGKKLHTGRSRNDQVAQDVRLFIRDETEEILVSLLRLLDVILNKAKRQSRTSNARLHSFTSGTTNQNFSLPTRLLLGV
jgi:argininosuccinate lyase